MLENTERVEGLSKIEFKELLSLAKIAATKSIKKGEFM